MNVSEDIVAILDAGTCEGGVFRLPNQLARPDYVAVNKVLVAAGMNWNRKLGGHTGGDDAEEAISDVILTGKIVSKKKEFDLFETPDNLIEDMLRYADIEPGMLCLEPSAGSGRIVRAMVASGGTVNVIEKDHAHAAALEELDCGVRMTDFLMVEPTKKYDRILMNPPFSKQKDIDHVLHAMSFLKQGGRLVAVMSVGVLFRQNHKTKDFRMELAEHGGIITSNPEGSFKASGTMVNTVMITIPAMP
ncbi:MAG: methyltransferase [Phycisphaeraceae bacterium]|nr:methyltransferase [Phycisphaeraceae bacterium]